MKMGIQPVVSLLDGDCSVVGDSIAPCSQLVGGYCDDFDFPVEICGDWLARCRRGVALLSTRRVVTRQEREEAPGTAPTSIGGAVRAGIITSYERRRRLT